MHIGDMDSHRKFMAEAAESESLTYHGVSSLQELSDALGEHSGRVYLVNESFRILGYGPVDFNAHKAVEAIRERQPDADIILFSGELNAEDVARELNVELIRKRDVGVFRVAKGLKGRLSERA